MSTKSILRNWNINFIIAGLFFISLLAELPLYLSGKSAIWVIVMDIIVIVSSILMGIKEKKTAIVDDKSEKPKGDEAKTPLSIIIVLILFFLFDLYYIYDIVKIGLKTGKFTPFTPTLIPILLLSLILIVMAEYYKRKKQK